MRSYAYHRVDVFTDRPFCGNPLAVFPDGQGLTTDEMQAIAAEMNLSETVFCLPAVDALADRRLRIFTVDREVPLAGHPVVGTWTVLAATGVVPVCDGSNELYGELGVGVLPVQVEMRGETVERVIMTQRNAQFGAAFGDRERLARCLGLTVDQLDPELPAREVDTGIPWFLIPVADVAALQAVQPDFAECRAMAQELGNDLIHAYTRNTGNDAVHARTRHVWFGSVTPSEDPVTGSACGCVASSLLHHAVVDGATAAHLIIEQGAEVGRPGRVHAFLEGDVGNVTRVRVGGSGVHLGSGEIWLGAPDPAR